MKLKIYTICIIILITFSGCVQGSPESKADETSHTAGSSSASIATTGETEPAPSRLPSQTAEETVSLAKELPYKDYTELLDALREHVEAVIQDPDIEMENDFFLEWALREPFMSCGEDYSEVRDKLGYALKDLNQNGKLDLILLNKEYFTVVAIITLVEDKPYLLNEYWSRHSCVIYDSGVIYSNSHAGAGDLDYMTQRISPDGSGFIQEVKFGATTTNDFGWYKEIDGIQYAIEQSEFDEFQKEYPHLSYPEAEEITKSAGLEFIPLFG